MISNNENFDMDVSDFYTLGLNKLCEMDNYGVVQVINNFNHWYKNYTKYENLGVVLDFKANKIEVRVGDGDKPHIKVYGANVSKTGFDEFMEELNRYFVIYNMGTKYKRIAEKWMGNHDGRRYDDDDEFFRIKVLKLTKEEIGDTQYSDIHRQLELKFRSCKQNTDLDFLELVNLAQGLGDDSELLDSVLKEISSILNRERKQFFNNMRNKNGYVSQKEVTLLNEIEKRRYTRLSIWDASDDEIEKLIDDLSDFNPRDNKGVWTDDELDKILEIIEENSNYVNELGFEVDEIKEYHHVMSVIEALEEVLDERLVFIEGEEHETELDDFEFGEKSGARIEEAKYKDQNMKIKQGKNKNPYYGYDDKPYDENSVFPGLEEILKRKAEKQKRISEMYYGL